MYKAIFFDRDGTLTYFNKEKEIGVTKLSVSGAEENLNLLMKK